MAPPAHAPFASLFRCPSLAPLSALCLPIALRTQHRLRFSLFAYEAQRKLQNGAKKKNWKFCCQFIEMVMLVLVLLLLSLPLLLRSHLLLLLLGLWHEEACLGFFAHNFCAVYNKRPHNSQTAPAPVRPHSRFRSLSRLICRCCPTVDESMPHSHSHIHSFAWCQMIFTCFDTLTRVV